MFQGKRKVTVLVSAVAFLSMPARAAMAAPTISCTRNITFGRIIPLCNGTITVRGTAASNTANNGCHSQVMASPMPAICTIGTTLATAASDVRITFASPAVTMDNQVGAGQVTLDNYLIQTAGGSQLNAYTFNASSINPNHVFRVGGRLRFGLGEPSGSYSTSFQVIVTAIP